MIAHLLCLVVRAYQLLLAPLLLPACRFEPSCSRYAIAALQTHGALRDGWLALRRLARCQPWGGCGYDPVPPARPCRCRAERPAVTWFLPCDAAAAVAERSECSH